MDGPIWLLEGVYINKDGEQVSTGSKTEAPEALAKKMCRRGGWKKVGEKVGAIGTGSGGSKWKPVDTPMAKGRRQTAASSD